MRASKPPPAPHDFSKLQLVSALFADTIGDDLYYARQVKESIEASLDAEQQADPEAFIRQAEQLAARIARGEVTAAIGLVPGAEDQTFSLLAFRARLLAAIKSTCRFERSLVVLTGLKEAICPAGKRWTVRRKREYQEAIDFARAFCRSRSRPSSQLSLVIF